jgi:NADH:ubiquinone oxidoreductase subunit F (NADH-binding)
MRTTCGHPAHSQAACGRCDACRDGRRQIEHVLSAAQYVVGCYDNDPRMLKDAMRKLQLALQRIKARAALEEMAAEAQRLNLPT